MLLLNDPLPEKHDIDRVLKFAQDMAKVEIDRIQRIHVLTVGYISVVFLLFGFLGWRNLQQIVLTQTRQAIDKKLYDEVKKRVDQELTNDVLDNALRQKLEAYSANELRGQMLEALKTGEVHDQIVRMIKQGQPAATHSPLTPSVSPARLITERQVQLFKQAMPTAANVAPYSKPADREQPTMEIRVVRDNEAYAFAAQVRSMLAEFGWKAPIVVDDQALNPANRTKSLVVVHPTTSEVPGSHKQESALADFLLHGLIAAQLNPTDATFVPRHFEFSGHIEIGKP